MYALLMTFFVIITVFLAIFVLMQQGKGDLGMSALGGGTQMLFGGSGGKNFFEKATWILGAIFIFGSLGLNILKTKEARHGSRFSGHVTKRKNGAAVPLSTGTPVQPAAAIDDEDFDQGPVGPVQAEPVGVAEQAATQEAAPVGASATQEAGQSGVVHEEAAANSSNGEVPAKAASAA